jgi:flagellar biosynthesis/type III secretory pathway M-ring protein FliF/YscJ
MNNQSLKLVLPWLLVVLLTSVLVFISIQPKPEITVLPPDNRIDSLHNIVDSLDQRIIDLRHDYDSAQQNIKDSIIYIQTKNAKDISNIHNYTLDQRDSLWSTFKP